MPKFHHGKLFGFEYKARATGWRCIPLLCLFPYFTASIIKIRLSLKPLTTEQAWESGLLSIEPPDLTEFQLGGQTVMVPVSDYAFAFKEQKQMQGGLPPKYKFPVGIWWVRTLSLKNGSYFDQPSNIKVNLVFQNTSDKLEKTDPIRIADFEVVARDSTIFNIIGWGITVLLAVSALIVSIIAIMCK